MSLSAYVHIPFCVRKCNYCSFYSQPSGPDIITDYVGALENQIYNSGFKGKKLKSVFYGGGTPSMLSPDLFLRLSDTMNSVFDISFSEITTELNPDTVDNVANHEVMNRLNRFSIGVQSFDDSELRLLGRLHDSAKAVDAYKLLRRHGANNINLDIMIALPGKEHLKKLENTLETAIALSPEHISAYILTPERGTPLFDKYGDFNEQIAPDIYLFVCEKLEKAGYEHYEISNFAKKGFRCIHNMCYWTQQYYLAFGPSACGFYDSIRYKIDCTVKDYLASNGLVPVSIEERLGEKELETEKLILSLRLADGTDKETLDSLISDDHKHRFIDNLLAVSLLRINDRGGISLTDKGFLVSNEIIRSLV